MASKWLIFIWRCADMACYGPYETDEERVEAARDVYREDSDRHAVYTLDIDDDGHPDIGDLPCELLDDEESDGA